MITFCNCHYNLNNFQIACHKAKFQAKLTVLKWDMISHMSTVEDTRTKSMLGDITIE